jgi:hypothetical protein
LILRRCKEVVGKIALRLRFLILMPGSDMPGNCNSGPHQRDKTEDRDGKENLHVS